MRKHFTTAIGALAAAVSCASLAQAQTVVTQPQPQSQTVVTQPAQPQTTVVAQPQPQPAPQQTIVAVPSGRETRETTTGGPNATLFTSGLLTFGVPYGISVVVAAESSRDGDKNLFIPIVGPWMAYANEGSCNTVDAACGRTTGSKVLLAADGIFQAIGGIELVAAFLMPETRTVASSTQGPRVMMAPARVGGSGYGVAATGAF
jgi:hypothetical protein